MPTVARKVRPHKKPAAILAKQTLVRALRAGMERSNESIQSLARRMGTGRTSVRRLLDESNTSITLATMIKAADAVGLEIELTARQMKPAELKQLAARLPGANSRNAAKLEDQIVAGFYGRRNGA